MLDFSAVTPTGPEISDAVQTPALWQWVSRGAGAFSALLGLTVLIGWYTHNDALLQINAGWVAMAYNTALGFFLCGAGLICATTRFKIATCVAGAYALVVGLLTLAEHLFSVETGLDQLLMHAYNSAYNIHPGRMAPNTALCLALCGLALLILSPPRRFRGRALALGLLGSVVASLGIVALAGYVGGLEGAYGWARFSAMSAHAALGFSALGLGIATLAWVVDRDETSAPSWLPILICAVVTTGTLVLWQALLGEDKRRFDLSSGAVGSGSALPEVVLIGGLALAFLVALTLYLGQTAAQRSRFLDSVNARLAGEIKERRRAEAALVKEQNFLTTLLDSLTEGVVACDQNGVIVLFNKTSRAWEQNETPEQSTPQKHGLFPLEGDAPLPPDQMPLARALRGEKTHNLEVTLRVPHAGDRTLKVNAQPIVDGDGRKLGAVAAMHDITERKRAESALRESEKRYRAASENSFDAFYVLQAVRDERGEISDFRIVDCNSRGAHLVSKTREELIGDLVFAANPQARAGGVFEKYKRVVQSGQALEDEHRTTAPGVAATWLRAQIVPLDDGVAITTRDITERKRNEENLRAFAADLERSNRELQDFASVASHDLQEPLRKIQAFGDRLKTRCRDDLSDEGQMYLDRMQSAAARMSTLINDLLAFSRVTIKALPFEQVDLNVIAREVTTDLETSLEESKGRVEIGALPTIAADALQMRQLFQNLLSNALKFARADVPPVVRISAKIIGGSCRLAFADNGIGFEQKYVDRIFTVFQRLHARGKYEGTGIGLAICRKIAERHGGVLSAQSAPGEGATFFVELPLAPKSTPEFRECLSK